MAPTQNSLAFVHPTPRFNGNDSTNMEGLESQMFTCEDEDDDIDEKVT